jgi:hypothetical protein
MEANFTLPSWAKTNLWKLTYAEDAHLKNSARSPGLFRRQKRRDDYRKIPEGNRYRTPPVFSRG